jgi:hypothetical protein
MNNSKDTIGHNDQEVLIRALVIYIIKKLDTSEGIVIGTFRLCIGEGIRKLGKSFKDVKTLPEAGRDAFYMEMFDMVIDRMKLNRTMRRSFKFDCLQIYERWKERTRDLAPVLPESAAGQAVTRPEIDKKKEDELLQDLDSLNLDDIEGFDL